MNLTGACDCWKQFLSVTPLWRENSNGRSSTCTRKGRFRARRALDLKPYWKKVTEHAAVGK
jgi:hypothetical protein